MHLWAKKVVKHYSGATRLSSPFFLNESRGRDPLWDFPLRVSRPVTAIENDRTVGSEKDDPLRVFSYVMSNGFIEHTMIQLTSRSNPNEGTTIEVEPLSGIVQLYPEIRGPEESFKFVPDTPPALP